jgi:hypothetical protein
MNIEINGCSVKFDKEYDGNIPYIIGVCYNNKTTGKTTINITNPFDVTEVVGSFETSTIKVDDFVSIIEELVVNYFPFSVIILDLQSNEYDRLLLLMSNTKIKSNIHMIPSNQMPEIKENNIIDQVKMMKVELEALLNIIGEEEE